MKLFFELYEKVLYDKNVEVIIVLSMRYIRRELVRIVFTLVLCIHKKITKMTAHCKYADGCMKTVAK